MEQAAPPLASQLRLAVLRLSRRLRQQSLGDVTSSQISALASVAKHGELSLGELAAIERVAPPSMTRIAARLEERGLVQRRTDRADRRVARVAISPAGEQFLEQTRNRRDAFLAVRLRRLSDEDLVLLERALPLLERLALDDTEGDEADPDGAGPTVAGRVAGEGGPDGQAAGAPPAERYAKAPAPS
jgi:DNA-binding MarR family transcriptional regulator